MTNYLSNIHLIFICAWLPAQLQFNHDILKGRQQSPHPFLYSKMLNDSEMSPQQLLEAQEATGECEWGLSEKPIFWG